MDSHVIINLQYQNQSMKIILFYLLVFAMIPQLAHSEQHQTQTIPQKQEKHDHSHLLNKEYKFLKPASKIDAGFFKSYQFDLRFPEIKDSMISKNVFEGVYDFISYKFSHQTTGKKKPKTQQDFELIQKQLPMVKTNFAFKTESDIRYTWIGHSTAVLQIGPDNFIIDPVFSQKKRYRPPACSIKQLPQIDVVLISHDHYDHFDSKSLKELNQRFNPLFIAGLGSDDILPKGSQIQLMDWMQTISLKLKGGQYNITFVPACHWCRRGIADLNMRLWGGFIIDTPFKKKIYYSGDTGFCQLFQQLGDKFGPVDLAILPIGAYQPRELLKAQHINPNQAVLIHKLMKSKQSVAVHWGTFSMGREGFVQPKYDLLKACEDNGISKDEFITVKHGQSHIF